MLTLLLLSLIFLGLLWGAFALGQRAEDSRNNFGRGGSSMMRNGDFGDGDDLRRGARGSTMQDGFRGQAGPMRTGDDANTPTSTRVSGVVTAVDGDTITVAGNGTTTRVTVNEHTSYVGDDKPAKTNDTVMASGARQSDGSLLASVIRLSRQ